MITFSNPAWLYGLIGLLIPIGIHLLSRKEGKTIYIGSIRHLTDSDTAQFSSIRLNEIVLLILRLVLLTLLVFILSGINVDFGSNENKRWLVIEKGVEKNDDYKPLIDSLKSQGFELRWFATDFPAFADSNKRNESSSYFKLLGEIQKKADSVIIISYNFANRFRGEKVSIPSSLKWLSADFAHRSIAVQAINTARDSVMVRVSLSNAQGTAFVYSRYSKLDFEKILKIDSLRTINTDTIRITIFAEREFDYDRKIIQASIQAIASRVPQKFDVSVVTNVSDIPNQSDFVFWLSEEPCTIKRGTIIGQAACINSTLPLITERERSIYYCQGAEWMDWIITRRLNEENALEESFSFSLANILLKDLAIYKDPQIANADQRSLSAEAAFADTNQDIESKQTRESQAGNEPPLMILLFLILIVERYIAYRRNQ